MSSVSRGLRDQGVLSRIGGGTRLELAAVGDDDLSTGLAAVTTIGLHLLDNI